MVKTLKGFVAPEFQMTLHVTRHALSLVTMNPPKCCKRWELSKISNYWSRDGIFFFKVDAGLSGEAGKPVRLTPVLVGPHRTLFCLTAYSIILLHLATFEIDPFECWFHLYTHNVCGA